MRFWRAATKASATRHSFAHLKYTLSCGHLRRWRNSRKVPLYHAISGLWLGSAGLRLPVTCYAGQRDAGQVFRSQFEANAERLFENESLLQRAQTQHHAPEMSSTFSPCLTINKGRFKHAFVQLYSLEWCLKAILEIRNASEGRWPRLIRRPSSSSASVSRIGSARQTSTPACSRVRNPWHA